jgi:lysozyme
MDFNWNLYPAVVADVRRWQGQIDWSAVADSGLVGLVIIKATQGVDLVDPYFERNRRGAIDNSVPWIPYAYLTEESPAAQARHFLSATGVKDIPAALDWEKPGVQAPVAEAFGTAVAEETRRDPLMYYGLYAPDTPTDTITKWPRWFPEYAPAPRLSPWGGGVCDWCKCWFIWQHTATGKIPGIDGNVDRSRISCSLSGLLSWYSTGVFSF